MNSPFSGPEGTHGALVTALLTFVSVGLVYGRIRTRKTLSQSMLLDASCWRGILFGCLMLS